VVISGGSDGLLTTTALSRALHRHESSFERPPHYFFFFTKAPMIRVTTEITQSQPGKTVNPNFLDESYAFLDKANQQLDRVKTCAASTSAGSVFG
jgi:hypothetical protein